MLLYSVILYIISIVCLSHGKPKNIINFTVGFFQPHSIETLGSSTLVIQTQGPAHCIVSKC